MTMRALHIALALWVSGSLASAGTLVVDVNNGPGTDFTNLHNAITAAQTDPMKGSSERIGHIGDFFITKGGVKVMNAWRIRMRPPGTFEVV